jgi:hypothetical protein
MPSKAKPSNRGKAAAKSPSKGKAADSARRVARDLSVEEYEAIMAEHREAYSASERARNQNRASKLSKREADKIMDANREPHRLYWAAYERRRALLKAGGANA